MVLALFPAAGLASDSSAAASSSSAGVSSSEQGISASARHSGGESPAAGDEDAPPKAASASGDAHDGGTASGADSDAAALEDADGAAATGSGGVRFIEGGDVDDSPNAIASPDGDDSADSNSTSLTYEDDSVKVTVASPSAFPQGVSIAVRELDPSDRDGAEDAERYTQALSRVSEEAAAAGTTVVDARAYDISLLDAYGNEIEPDQAVQVVMEHKQKVDLNGAADDEAELGVAHVMDNQQVEFVDAEFETDQKARVERTAFEAQGFSVYVVFNGTPYTQSTRPLNTGQYGWIRFGGNIVTGVDMPGNGSVNDGWRKFLKVNIYTLADSANAGSRNPADYTLANSYTKLSTWDTAFTIEDYEFNAADIWSTYRVSHQSDFSSPQNGVVVGPSAEYCYLSGQWVDASHIPPNGGFYADTNELNVYLGSTATEERTTTAIVTYEHADGTTTSETTILHEGESLSVNQAGHAAGGETYAGIEVTKGAAAVSNVDTANGTATVSYNANEPEVNITISYAQQTQPGQTMRYNITFVHADGSQEQTSGLLQMGETYELTEAMVNARAKSDESVQTTTTDNSWAAQILDAGKGTVRITGRQNVGAVNVTIRFQQVATTAYIVRYYHADGSFDEVDGTLRPGETLNVDEAANRRDGEAYSGTTITTGNAAVSMDTSSGSGTITGTSGVRLAKVNVYYKKDIPHETGGAVTGAPQYDAEQTPAGKVYDTSREGLHTDKTATLHEGAGGSAGDGRTFDLKLESWNIQQNIANIGMVLDASGSMVWPSNLPEQYQQGMNDWKALFGQNWSNKTTTGTWPWQQQTTWNYLTADQLAMVLDPLNTDNSKINYNGYKYYVYHNLNSIHEHVALAYYSRSTDPGYLFARTDSRKSEGWYYVNSSFFSNGTGKQLCGVGVDPARFYVADDGTLHCQWDFGNSSYDSPVYVKADDVDTKSETLQNAIARFVAELNAGSPQSEVAMTRFSSPNFANQLARLMLLRWTNDSSEITAAMNQEYGSPSDHSDSHSASGEYNYAITGGTVTYTGIGAYMSLLTNNRPGSYEPTNGNDADSKYLIIFTDGKDTSGTGMNTARQYATSLKQAGYTIITVLMESAGMSASNELADARSFLTDLAGTRAGNDGADYFFSAAYDDPEALVEKFQEIALKISKPLQGYTVRDYIDPRFDLVDANGNVLTRLNDGGGFADTLYQTPDGKRAMLKYDSGKNMFYLEWTDQEIPSTVRDADEVSVWSSTITVRAKEDFLGGNDMLTNGNESGQNQVFDPQNPGNPHKDFPKTTVNPETLVPSIGDYEDTVFLGESPTAMDLYGKIIERSDGSPFLEYLERLAVHEGKPSAEYVNQLMATGSLELPYYYLPVAGSATSYAGGALHQADRVGTLRYTWTADDFAPTATTDKTATIRVEYTPAPFDAGAGDRYDDNGSPRTRTLIGVDPGTQDALIRDWDGPAASDRSADAVAVVHAVDGRIYVEKRMDKQALLKYVRAHAGDTGSLTFTLTPAEGGMARAFAIPLPATVDAVNALPTDGDMAIVGGEWVRGLPRGTYTLQELDDSALFEEVSYSAVEYTGADEATQPYYEAKGESDATHFNAASDGQATWQIGVTPQYQDRHYDNSDFSRAAVTDATKEVDVAIAGDDAFQAGGKAYLNAQIGKAVVTNTFLPTAELEILKRGTLTDGSQEDLPGVAFELYTATVEGDTWSRGDFVAGGETDASGGLVFGSLGDGTYLLYETRAAAGYQLPSEPWKVTVANGEVTSVLDPYGAEVPAGTSANVSVRIIYNNVQPNLPLAGGDAGYLAALVAGLVLLVAALGLIAKLLITRRREGRAMSG